MSKVLTHDNMSWNIVLLNIYIDSNHKKASESWKAVESTGFPLFCDMVGYSLMLKSDVLQNNWKTFVKP